MQYNIFYSWGQQFTLPDDFIQAMMRAPPHFVILNFTAEFPKLNQFRLTCCRWMRVWWTSRGGYRTLALLDRWRPATVCMRESISRRYEENRKRRLLKRNRLCMQGEGKIQTTQDQKSDAGYKCTVHRKVLHPPECVHILITVVYHIDCAEMMLLYKVLRIYCFISMMSNGKRTNASMTEWSNWTEAVIS